MKTSEDDSKKIVQLPSKDAFANKQLDIFQSFYANTDEQRSDASNSIELWDSVPRYSMSQQTMNKIRDDKGRLDLLEIPFNYRQASLKAIIQPALIQEEKDGVKSTVSYYPSANEELIEEALRKIATIQQMGFHEPMKRSGVVFTLYQLREELRQRGHTRSFNEIIKSLTILSSSIIEINGEDKQRNKSYGKRSAYFPAVTWVNQADLAEDTNAKWHVQFHPLVTDSIDKLSYRQFNYQQLMSHNTQLARWLHKYLVSKYTMASKMKPFEMRYSTIKRDSAMLSGYKVERQAIAACDFSMEELKTQKIAHEIKRNTVTGARNKIIDVVYTISPTLDFIAEVKAANARQGQLKSQ
ncbi:MAG: replication protein [Methylococcales bacterium]